MGKKEKFALNEKIAGVLLFALTVAWMFLEDETSYMAPDYLDVVYLFSYGVAVVVWTVLSCILGKTYGDSKDPFRAKGKKNVQLFFRCFTDRCSVITMITGLLFYCCKCGMDFYGNQKIIFAFAVKMLPWVLIISVFAATFKKMYDETKDCLFDMAEWLFLGLLDILIYIELISL